MVHECVAVEGKGERQRDFKGCLKVTATVQG